jgi:hypothetical protein
LIDGFSNGLQLNSFQWAQRNNLLFRGDRIVGVIDWDDARIASVERELSCAVWEFCADPIQSTLDPLRAARFLDVYTAHGGPVPATDRTFIVPFIRDYLRCEIRRALTTGDEIDGGCLESEMQAFVYLRGRSL